MLTFGPWTTLGELRDGTLFDRSDGHGVKVRYSDHLGRCGFVILGHGQVQCVGPDLAVREILLGQDSPTSAAEEERNLIIAWIERDGETVSTDAPLHSYAGGYRRACENLASSIRLGMHVPKELAE